MSVSLDLPRRRAGGGPAPTGLSPRRLSDSHRWIRPSQAVRLPLDVHAPGDPSVNNPQGETLHGSEESLADLSELCPENTPNQTAATVPHISASTRDRVHEIRRRANHCPAPIPSSIPPTMKAQKTIAEAGNTPKALLAAALRGSNKAAPAAPPSPLATSHPGRTERRRARLTPAPPPGSQIRTVGFRGDHRRNGSDLRVLESCAQYRRTCSRRQRCGTRRPRAQPFASFRCPIRACGCPLICRGGGRAVVLTLAGRANPEWRSDSHRALQPSSARRTLRPRRSDSHRAQIPRSQADPDIAVWHGRRGESGHEQWTVA